MDGNPMADTPEAVQTFFSKYSPSVQALANALRELILPVIPPEFIETVQLGNGNIVYGTKPGMRGPVIYIAPFKDSANLGFMDGVDLPDPKGLLKGTGKRLRHIKIKSVDDIDIEAFTALLRAAVALHT